MHFAALDVGEEAAMTPTLRASDRQLGSLKREERGWVVERPDPEGNLAPTCTTSPREGEERLGSYKRQKIVAYVVARRVADVRNTGDDRRVGEDQVQVEPCGDDRRVENNSEEVDVEPCVAESVDKGAAQMPEILEEHPASSSSTSEATVEAQPKAEPKAQARAKGVKIFVKGRGEVKRQHVADVLRLCLDNLPFGDMYQLSGSNGLTKTPRITYEHGLHLKNYGDFYKHVMEKYDIDLVEVLHHHPERLIDVAAADRNFFR